jgi:hypothetical protein
LGDADPPRSLAREVVVELVKAAAGPLVAVAGEALRDALAALRERAAAKAKRDEAKP